MMNGSVIYAYSRQGYEIVVMDAGGKVIEEYSAGNHKLDSQQHTDDPQWRLPLRSLRRYARQTALEMAKEHGIPRTMVSLDRDRMRDMAENDQSPKEGTEAPVRQVRVVKFTISTRQPSQFNLGLADLCREYAVADRNGKAFGYVIKVR